MPRRESEKMEVQDEAKKENQVFGSAGIAKFVSNGVNLLGNDNDDDGGPTMRLEDTRAVVIMNAHCSEWKCGAPS